LDKPYFQNKITIKPLFSPNLDYEGQFLFPVPNLIPYKPLFVKPLYQVYNVFMSPRHFAAYQKRDPKGYQAFSDNMWNGFVSITKHVPIVNRFFSFSPAEFQVDQQTENKITNA
jgi:hypothetical protein